MIIAAPFSVPVPPPTSGFGLDGPTGTSCNGSYADGKRPACNVPSAEGWAAMSAWWWVLIGLAAWFGVALAVGLILGPVLRRSSQAREALDAQLGRMGETPDGREGPPQGGQPRPPQDGPRAA